MRAPMSDFILHPRLLADWHQLGRLTAAHVHLHGNTALPNLLGLQSA